MTAPTPGAPDVAELRRLLAAGNDVGNWTVYESRNGWHVMFAIPEPERTVGGWPEADAALAVAAVNALPALLDRLDALEAALIELTSDHRQHGCDDRAPHCEGCSENWPCPTELRVRAALDRIPR